MSKKPFLNDVSRGTQRIGKGLLAVVIPNSADSDLAGLF